MEVDKEQLGFCNYNPLLKSLAFATVAPFSHAKGRDDNEEEREGRKKGRSAIKVVANSAKKMKQR